MIMFDRLAQFLKETGKAINISTVYASSVVFILVFFPRNH